MVGLIVGTVIASTFAIIASVYLAVKSMKSHRLPHHNSARFHHEDPIMTDRFNGKFESSGLIPGETREGSNPIFQIETTQVPKTKMEV